MKAYKRVEDYLREPYSRIVIPDPSGGFTAQILEFPGCFAEGETLEEAYKNLEDAARSWLEAAIDSQQTIPEPQQNDESAYSGKVLVRLAKSLHRDAAAAAARDGVSLNQYLVTAIAEKVGMSSALSQVRRMEQSWLDAVRSINRCITDAQLIPTLGHTVGVARGTFIIGSFCKAATSAGKEKDFVVGETTALQQLVAIASNEKRERGY